MVKVPAKNIVSLVLKGLVYAAMGATAVSLIGILGYIVVNGALAFKLSLIFGKYSSDNPSMAFSVFTTCAMIFLTLLIAAPVS
ncbi:MAG: hypothetical protein LBH93_01665, partial [Chitinispirillales bacterium]|nr:hypothetical protein [Chitinispirillales bacterium]